MGNGLLLRAVLGLPEPRLITPSSQPIPVTVTVTLTGAPATEEASLASVRPHLEGSAVRFWLRAGRR